MPLLHEKSMKYELPHKNKKDCFEFYSTFHLGLISIPALS